MHHKIYIAIVSLAFVALTVVMLCFPRSRYSELEKRDLAQFPEFTIEKLVDNTYSGELSSWFSDSEPFRDDFMSLSMQLRHALKLSTGNNVTFHATAAEGDPFVPESDDDIADGDEQETADSIAIPVVDGTAKMANAGIMIVGSGDDVRALMAFGGGASGGKAYASALNRLKSELPGVNVYSMVVPLAIEFYCPESAKKHTRPQKPFIDHVASMLSGVRPVDAYSALAAHVGEPIYLRTDHHWAPLGAYYAAAQLAKTAGVPFRGLDAYTKHTVKRFVGSMYGYSKDISVKNAPEDFDYYVPSAVDYNTTYIVYTLNKDYHITNVSKPHKGPYFYHFKDGNSGAYSTFMGGDMKLTKVQTGTNNGRRLLIIKDSYGNAVPGYMFYSFEEVHVIDFRYFTKNLKQYVADNGITDIATVFNVFNAYSGAAAGKITKYLSQSGFTPAPSTPAEHKKDVKTDTVKSAGKPVVAESEPEEDTVAEVPVESAPDVVDETADE